MASYQVIARRFRPQRFEQVMGQETVLVSLQNAIRRERIAAAYLFSGGRGCGKTTLARIFAKALNCPNCSDEAEPCGLCDSCLEIANGTSLNVLEIDGASHRGIDDVRQINETVIYAAAKGGWRIYIIDEVHMLTKEAFNALLKTLEEPPPKVLFLFATTEPHKLPNTILSRCQRFHLKRPPPSLIKQKLSDICSLLKNEVEEAALQLIADHAQGAFRDAESLLDQLLSFNEGKLTREQVEKALGLMPREAFFVLDQAADQGDYKKAFTIVEELFSQGKNYLHFLEMLLEHYRILLLLQIDAKESLPDSIQEPQVALLYRASAKIYLPQQCMAIIDMILEAQEQIRFSSTPRFALEALLLRIMKSQKELPYELLIEKLRNIEKNAAAIASSQTKATQIDPPSASVQSQPVQSQPVVKTAIKPNLQSSADSSSPSFKAESNRMASFIQEVDVQKIDSREATKPAMLKTEKSEGFTREKTEGKSENNHFLPQHRYDTLLQFSAVELEGRVEFYKMGRSTI